MYGVYECQVRLQSIIWLHQLFGNFLKNKTHNTVESVCYIKKMHLYLSTPLQRIRRGYKY